MKKLISYVLVFVLGFGACALILDRLGYVPSAGKDLVIKSLTGKPVPPVVRKGSNPIADAAAVVGPAVVNIDTMGERSVVNPFGMPLPSEKQRFIGQGSGVIISKDGYILTNNHVVAGAKNIRVRLADGRKFDARLVGRDANSEVAVIKVKANDLPVVKLGDSDSIRVGDWAIAIGNPLGFGNTVTVGVISATKRMDLPVAEGRSLKEAIQTDAAINRGNSGGALANVNGEVIGINTVIYSTEPGQGNIGLGFAIPINSAKGILKRLIEKGSTVRPWLGIVAADLSGNLAVWYEQNGYKSNKGAVVWQVEPNSPAEKAGLTQGDIITQIDKVKISNSADLVKTISKHKPGDVIRLSVWRMGKTILIGVKLKEMPQDMG